MASRVNTKFVVLLSASLLGLCALVAVAGLLLFRNSAADHAKLGDRRAAEGNYREAAERYSRAVNKENTNVGYLEKWRDALSKQTPTEQVRYSNAFNQYVSALRQLAIVQPDNVEAQRAYLELTAGRLNPNAFDRDGNDFLTREADTLLAARGDARGPWDVLRRYRGLARLRLLANTPDAKAELDAQARADLEAASAADPADAEVAQGLEAYWSYKAFRADADARPEDAAAARAAGAEVVRAFLANNPGSGAMQLTALRRDLADLVRDLQATDNKDGAARSNAFRETARPRLDAAAEALRAGDAARVSLAALNELRTLEGTLDGAARFSRTEAVAKAALDARPDDAELMSFRADIMASRDDHDASIAQLEQMVQLPPRPVSLEGMRLASQRIDARHAQAQLLVRKWAAAKEQKEKDELAARVTALRATLADLEAADSPRMLLIDANLAFMQGNDRRAGQLVEQYNSKTRARNPDALLLAAQIAFRQNQLGAAKENLTKLLAIQPADLNAGVFLADVEAQLQNFAAAEAMYVRLLEAVPGSEPIQDRLSRVRAAQGQGTLADPVAQTLLEADRMAEAGEGKPETGQQVIDFLRAKANENGMAPRLALGLAYAQMRENKRDAALADIRAALQAHPDSGELRAMEIALSTADPLEARLAVIDSAKPADLDRRVRRYLTYKTFGKRDLAKAELDAAAALAPDDKGIIEYRFMEALEAKDMPAAQALADRAVAGDFDGSGGLTYRARIEAAQGNTRDAIARMEQVIAAGGAPPEAYRLLGRLQLVAGRPGDAAGSFRQALERRPTDVASVNDLLTALAAMNRREEALQEARRYKQYAQGDADFLDTWLNLEAAIGDARMAIDRRERMARAEPGDRGNLSSLALVYLDAGAKDEARKIINQLRAAGDDLESVGLDAAWHWAQGDRPKAEAVFEEHIATLDLAKTGPMPYMVMAQFFLTRNDTDRAIAALEKARPFQTPAPTKDRPVALEADKALADTFIRVGKKEEGVAAARRVVEAGADTEDASFRKRLAEGLLGLGKVEEAKAALAPLAAAPAPDMVTTLLMADIRAASGDTRGQRELLDQAVSRFPSAAMVFLRRGQALAAEESGTRDAIEDFSRAIQLDPAMWQALRLRAVALDRIGKTEEGFTDLRASLKLNFSDNDLLERLLRQYVALGREQDAEETATEVVALRPRDWNVRYAVGDFFARQGLWNRAVPFFRDAYAITQQDLVAQRYLDALLSITPPAVKNAEDVLTGLGDRVAKSPGFTMASARAKAAQGKPADAGRAAVDALRLLDQRNPVQMVAWYNDVRRIEPDGKRRRQLLDDMMRSNVATEWLGYFRTGLLIDDVSKDEGLRQLRAIAEGAQLLILRQLSWRALGTGYYQLGRFQEAATSLEDGLKAYPGDTEMTNNLAFIYAKKLGRFPEALTLAESAVKTGPESHELLDTLGVALMLNGRDADAIPILERALLMAKSPQAVVVSSAHLASAHLAVKDAAKARDVLAIAEQIVKESPDEVDAEAETELQEARTQAGAS